MVDWEDNRAETVKSLKHLKVRIELTIHEIEKATTSEEFIKALAENAIIMKGMNPEADDRL